MVWENVFLERVLPGTSISLQLRGNSATNKLGAIFSLVICGIHELGHALASYLFDRKMTHIRFQGTLFFQQATVCYETPLSMIEPADGLICMAGPLFNGFVHTLCLTQIAFQKHRSTLTEIRKHIHQWLLCSEVFYAVQSYLKDSDGDFALLARYYPAYAKIMAASLTSLKLLPIIYNEPFLSTEGSLLQKCSPIASKFASECMLLCFTAFVSTFYLKM